MTDRIDIRDDLEPGAPEDLILLAERLHDSRPLPSPAFRGALGRRLQTRSRKASPARLRALIALYGGAGTVLLLAGTVSAAGAGPLG